MILREARSLAPGKECLQSPMSVARPENIHRFAYAASEIPGPSSCTPFSFSAKLPRPESYSGPTHIARTYYFFPHINAVIHQSLLCLIHPPIQLSSSRSTFTHIWFHRPFTNVTLSVLSICPNHLGTWESILCLPALSSPVPIHTSLFLTPRHSYDKSHTHFLIHNRYFSFKSFTSHVFEYTARL